MSKLVLNVIEMMRRVVINRSRFPPGGLFNQGPPRLYLNVATGGSVLVVHDVASLGEEPDRAFADARFAVAIMSASEVSLVVAVMTTTTVERVGNSFG